MNTDNLSGAYYFATIVNNPLLSGLRQRDTPVDKGLSCGQKERPHCKYPLQIYLPTVIFSGIILIGMYFFTYNANFTK